MNKTLITLKSKITKDGYYINISKLKDCYCCARVNLNNHERISRYGNTAKQAIIKMLVYLNEQRKDTNAKHTQAIY